MQSNLVNPKISKSKILSSEDYRLLDYVHEFILYSDNILEGITLLNDLTQSEQLLSFFGVIYEPIDQPIYVFQDNKNKYYSIKICGNFDKWDLPKQVDAIKQFVDLPDYIFYSLTSKKVILAGENTETASVGNSQWQREGRKLGAAKNGTPFIYQTFYSGKDESQDTIREPSSLQVYNQLLYTIRYQVPSIVAYFENNFEGAKTRDRIPEDSKDLFQLYIKSVLLSDVDPNNSQIKEGLEKKFFIHMLEYLKEGKYAHKGKINKEARLIKDFPVINNAVKDAILSDTDNFVSDLLDYIYNRKNDFIQKYPIDDLNKLLFVKWTAYSTKQWIKDIIFWLDNKHIPIKSYISGMSKVGIGSCAEIQNFLVHKFPDKEQQILKKLSLPKYEEAIVMPLRIHKYSNGVLTFSPDPESGEIVAFCELFGYDYKQQKKRPVIGYGIVELPQNFELDSKIGTKLYKALSNYIDVLILENKTLITEFTSESNKQEEFDIPNSLLLTKPKGATEEMAVVSTYLNQTTISSNWLLCFIHTHHSSWQQLVIHNTGKDFQEKIDRKSTKVDLILQDQNSTFMVAEGKNDYFDLLRDTKIQKAMTDSAHIIDKLYKLNHRKFDAFIYNLATHPGKDPEFYIQCEYEKVLGAIKRGHFNDIAFEKDYVIIIVYINQHNRTAFKLVYSPDFDTKLKVQLDSEFHQ